MLSDKEWKAIKKVKYICDKWYDENLEIDVKWLESLLNLCEKQSKEIEELKEKNENLLDALNNSIDIRKYWVHKDKIKAKIEELYKERAEYADTPEWELFDYLGGQIEVLQSLLEKE